MLEAKLKQAEGGGFKKEEPPKKTEEDLYKEKQEKQEKELLAIKRKDGIDLVTTCIESFAFLYYMQYRVFRKDSVLVDIRLCQYNSYEYINIY